MPFGVEELSVITPPPPAVAMTKRLLYDIDGLEFSEAIEQGIQVNAKARMADDCQKRIARFVEK